MDLDAMAIQLRRLMQYEPMLKAMKPDYDRHVAEQKAAAEQEAKDAADREAEKAKRTSAKVTKPAKGQKGAPDDDQGADQNAKPGAEATA
jgi:hypothetical protein